MSPDRHAAREALRARQGAGARYDAESAPHADLLLARRGTAYLARKLNELSDEALSLPSRRPGRSRRHLVAHVSYQAREMALLLKALREPLVAEEADWRPDVALAATLPARALRHLFEHSAKHLDVEWRDLSDANWAARLDTMAGTQIIASQSPTLRATEVWQAALDMDNGGRLNEVPEKLRERMVAYLA